MGPEAVCDPRPYDQHKLQEEIRGRGTGSRRALHITGRLYPSHQTPQRPTARDAQVTTHPNLHFTPALLAANALL